MLLCHECEIYVAAVVEHEGRLLSTLNAIVLEARNTLDLAPPLASYAGETAEQRVARRLAHWTPAQVVMTDG